MCLKTNTRIGGAHVYQITFHNYIIHVWRGVSYTIVTFIYTTVILSSCSRPKNVAITVDKQTVYKVDKPMH